MKPVRFVLDTYAILAELRGEAGGPWVKDLLQQGKTESVDVLVNYVHLGECYYVLVRGRGRERADEIMALVKAWPVTFIPVAEDLAISAGYFKGRYPMSFADAFAAATAKAYEATLVTGDPEFRACESEISIHWLN